MIGDDMSDENALYTLHTQNCAISFTQRSGTDDRFETHRRQDQYEVPIRVFKRDQVQVRNGKCEKALLGVRGRRKQFSNETVALLHRCRSALCGRAAHCLSRITRLHPARAPSRASRRPQRSSLVCAGRLHEALDGFPNLRKDLSFAILSFAQRVFKTDRLRAARSCV